MLQPADGWAGRADAPPRSPLLPSAAPAPIRVCIAYDNIAVGRRAMDLAVKLAGDCGGQLDLPPSFWRFDVLENDACREAATDDAEAADVIVIGMSQAENLEGIDGWLEQALVRREGTAVAVVALVPELQVSESLIDARVAALAEIAGRHGADFFVNAAGGELPVDSPAGPP
jgi:hypothetical protein